jgi:hypothetical protein
MCSLESIENICAINENEDIYPCENYKCDKYHKSIDKFDALKNAIYYVKPSRVQELLSQFDDNEITNPKLFSTFYANLLHSTISKITGTTGMGKGIPTILKIGIDSFKETQYEKYPNQIIGSKLFLEIIEMICIKYSWMINYRCYTTIEHYAIQPILDILNKYRIVNPDEITCVYCNSPHPEQLIKKPCECVGKYTHIKCLVNAILKTPNLNGLSCCLECTKSYDSYKCPKGRISFPKLNIYKLPLSDEYIQINLDNKYEQLRFACAYLCVDRVKELLDSWTCEEFKKIISEISTPKKDLNEIFIKCQNFIILDSKLFIKLYKYMYQESFEKINVILFSKQIDLMEYSCLSDIKMSWGKYVWCGNTSSPTSSGFTLTNSPNVDLYGNNYAYAMKLTLKPNEKLLKDCSFYDIYKDDGFLFGYNRESLTSDITVFKKIKPEEIESELKIVFSKAKKLTVEQEEKLKRSLCGFPKESVYSIKIKIPELIQYGEKIDCNICLEQVTEETNKYISPCGHLFHLDCIFTHLESKNLLYSIHKFCNNSRCCGAKKIKPFECVVCKTLITK